MIFPVDNTRLMSIAACTTQAVIRHGLGYSGKGSKIAADVGNAFHAGLMHWFLGEDIGASLCAFEDEYKKLEKEWKEAAEPRLGLVNARAVFEIWLERHAVDSFPWIVMEAERTVGVPLEGGPDGIEFFMKRDLLVKTKDTGFYYPVDHKSTGRITDWWSKKFRLGSQMTGYMWGTQRQVGFDKPVQGAFINAIELAKLPEPSDKKCATHKVKYSECWKAHAKGELLVVGRTPAKLEIWEKDARMLARRLQAFVDGFKDFELVTLLPQEGMFNDGCTFCEFGEFCKFDRNPAMVETLLQYNPWAPWDGGK
ncbi:MAG: PD-(D/E)XK nuclease family protein [Methanosarcinaceae archaeon]|nr:PD-(D/E)XK nuclease family protein [Methanosarcinaceae archaeon]